MIEQHIQDVLEQRQWTIIVNDVSPIARIESLIVLWKMYADHMTVTLTIREEDHQFKFYTDLGHWTGTDRVASSKFSTLEAAMDHLVQECGRLDAMYET